MEEARVLPPGKFKPQCFCLVWKGERGPPVIVHEATVSLHRTQWEPNIQGSRSDAQPDPRR